MPLGSNVMSIGMKLAWTIARITGMSIYLVSSVVLKIIWTICGGKK